MSTTALTKPVRRRALVAGVECTLGIEMDAYGVYLTVRKARARRALRFNLSVAMKRYLSDGGSAPSLLEQGVLEAVV